MRGIIPRSRGVPRSRYGRGRKSDYNVKRGEGLGRLRRPFGEATSSAGAPPNSLRRTRDPRERIPRSRRSLKGRFAPWLDHEASCAISVQILAFERRPHLRRAHRPTFTCAGVGSAGADPVREDPEGSLRSRAQSRSGLLGHASRSSPSNARISARYSSGIGAGRRSSRSTRTTVWVAVTISSSSSIR